MADGGFGAESGPWKRSGGEVKRYASKKARQGSYGGEKVGNVVTEGDVVSSEEILRNEFEIRTWEGKEGKTLGVGVGVRVRVGYEEDRGEGPLAAAGARKKLNTREKKHAKREKNYVHGCSDAASATGSFFLRVKTKVFAGVIEERRAKKVFDGDGDGGDETRREQRATPRIDGERLGVDASRLSSLSFERLGSGFGRDEGSIVERRKDTSSLGARSCGGWVGVEEGKRVKKERRDNGTEPNDRAGAERRNHECGGQRTTIFGKRKKEGVGVGGLAALRQSRQWRGMKRNEGARASGKCASDDTGVGEGSTMRPGSTYYGKTRERTPYGRMRRRARRFVAIRGHSLEREEELMFNAPAQRLGVANLDVAIAKSTSVNL
ncbi:hypothetical protein C8R43DRAFT_1108885 [Mycena crocata]|nr:hypothetical protein C8R43DRAFT_1108885 [Mycena crocata]